ncbi:MAG: phospho-sugar mutase [Mycobacteriaceae bacterium]|nr:phospho-sugar mutase [Mycobacteriaceae bacterium]
MTPEEWIAHDPDPGAAAELSACTPAELAARFSGSLTFGTAGLRGPLRAGPTGMNVAVVLRATWALARVLKRRRLAGSVVFVGYDARRGSQSFAASAAEVLAAEGFSVSLLPQALPTPVLAFAVRRAGAAAGVQITASHNPASDNGYKVFLDGGMQIVSPTDREIETAIAQAPYADQIARAPVAAVDSDVVEHYLGRVAGLRRGSGDLRVALTPLHGVGGPIALEALRRAGFTDVHTVTSQFAPDAAFPTVAFPNPEEPGAVDALLDLAARKHADLAIALDPDADRCAIGIPHQAGWRMLTGDETGWLIGDYILRHAAATTPPAGTVASTVVSSRMLAAIAAAHGARHVETLTGFKWLARAAGEDLAYAYEEAIGHSVDPAAVRDKDGISAAVLCCDLAAAAKSAGRAIPDLLDELARRHGVHLTAAITQRTDDAAAVMNRLRGDPPALLAGCRVEVAHRADVVILNGNDRDSWLRLAVRPSGTEPKVKGYIEVGLAPTDELAGARRRADELCAAVRRDAAELFQRGPN